jgi:hypothetical protein
MKSTALMRIAEWSCLSSQRCQPGHSGDAQTISSLSRRLLLLGSVSLSALPKPVPEHPYLFATNEYEIRMTLEFYDHYIGDGLSFQERLSDRHFCLSPKGEENRNCVSNFDSSEKIVGGFGLGQFAK